MQKQNATEYKLVRAEIDSIKRCITQYMSFLFLGIGAAFSAWGGIAAVGTTAVVYAPIAYSSLAISLIAVFMLYILIYKFVSHNRYVGYCLLISRKLWNCESKRDDDVLIWELCLQGLRVEDAKAQIPPEFKSLLGQSSAGRTESAWSFLIQTFFRLQKTYSWGFPITIVRIFLVVIWSCMLFGWYILSPQAWRWFRQLFDGGISANGLMALGILLGITLLQVIFFFNIAQRFYSIMMGQSTISSFCERFLPIRNGILRNYFGVTPEYIFLEGEEKVGQGRAQVVFMPGTTRATPQSY